MELSASFIPITMAGQMFKESEPHAEEDAEDHDDHHEPAWARIIKYLLYFGPPAAGIVLIFNWCSSH